MLDHQEIISRQKFSNLSLKLGTLFNEKLNDNKAVLELESCLLDSEDVFQSLLERKNSLIDKKNSEATKLATLKRVCRFPRFRELQQKASLKSSSIDLLEGVSVQLTSQLKKQQSLMLKCTKLSQKTVILNKVIIDSEYKVQLQENESSENEQRQEALGNKKEFLEEKIAEMNTVAMQRQTEIIELQEEVQKKHDEFKALQKKLIRQNGEQPDNQIEHSSIENVRRETEIKLLQTIEDRIETKLGTQDLEKDIKIQRVIQDRLKNVLLICKQIPWSWNDRQMYKGVSKLFNSMSISNICKLNEFNNLDFNEDELSKKEAKFVCLIKQFFEIKTKIYRENLPLEAFEEDEPPVDKSLSRSLSNEDKKKGSIIQVLNLKRKARKSVGSIQETELSSLRKIEKVMMSQVDNIREISKMMGFHKVEFSPSGNYLFVGGRSIKVLQKKRKNQTGPKKFKVLKSIQIVKVLDMKSTKNRLFVVYGKSSNVAVFDNQLKRVQTLKGYHGNLTRRLTLDKMSKQIHFHSFSSRFCGDNQRILWDRGNSVVSIVDTASLQVFDIEGFWDIDSDQSITPGCVVANVSFDRVIGAGTFNGDTKLVLVEIDINKKLILQKTIKEDLCGMDSIRCMEISQDGTHAYLGGKMGSWAAIGSVELNREMRIWKVQKLDMYDYQTVTRLRRVKNSNIMLCGTYKSVLILRETSKHEFKYIHGFNDIFEEEVNSLEFSKSCIYAITYPEGCIKEIKLNPLIKEKFLEMDTFHESYKYKQIKS